MSPVTGYRRQGTRFECFREIFECSADLKSVFEPVLYCRESDNAMDARLALEKRDFDTTCVVNSENNIVGKICRSALGKGLVSEYVLEIQEDETVDENYSLVDLLDTLKTSNFKYVTSIGSVFGIITRSDLNKPIPRTYLFGVVSLVELHMNFWVNYNYPENSWVERLKKDRQEKLESIIKNRKNSGDYLTVVDCAQFSDKKEILRNTPEFLAKFEFSKNSYKKFMERLVTFRDELAHSQSSIVGELTWDGISSTIARAEQFLKQSDSEIESDGNKKSNNFTDDILIPIERHY